MLRYFLITKQNNKKAGVKLPAGFANVFVRSLGGKNIGSFIAVGGSGPA